jgi:ribosome biogenesis protein Tsr3
VAKKTTRGQKLNESQLRAYRERKAETIITPRAQPVVAAEDGAAVRQQVVTGWGNVAEEYQMIRGDIKRLLLITLAMLVLLIVLWFVLG